MKFLQILKERLKGKDYKVEDIKYVVKHPPTGRNKRRQSKHMGKRDVRATKDYADRRQRLAKNRKDRRKRRRG